MTSTARSSRSRGGPVGRAMAIGGVIVFGLTAQAPPPPAEATVEVNAIRFWTLGDVTRIAVETSGETKFLRDRLHNPERLFFDLKGARSKLGKQGFQVIPVGDKLVSRIRIAQTQPTVARIVLDLASDVEFTASQLANPCRLMIELRPAGGVKAAAKPVPAPKVASAVPPPEAKPAAVTPPRMEARAVPEAEAATPAPLREKKPVAATPPRTEAKTPSPPRAPSAAPPPETRPVAAAPPLTEVKTPPPSPVETAVPAKKNSRGERSLTRVLGLKVGRIVIDAGHGGHDHGTTGPTGLTEKELALDLAQRLGALVEDELGSEVVYTRTDDTFLPLETRTEIANEAKADLFLSIHANSSPVKYVTGVETYYLNFTTSKADLEVAARENATSQKTIHELTELLQKIAKKDKAEESREFAAKVQSALYSATVRQNARARNRGVKKAPFVVLIGASMPSVLVEIGFISNARDEAQFRKPEYRQRMAEALFKGLSQYAGTLSHFQVAQAKTP